MAIHGVHKRPSRFVISNVESGRTLLHAVLNCFYIGRRAPYVPRYNASYILKGAKLLLRCLADQFPVAFTVQLSQKLLPIRFISRVINISIR